MRDISTLHFILHVSDFHITDGNKEVISNALQALISKLREEHIKIDYLLHTGDVIGASDLYEKTASELDINNYYASVTKEQIYTGRLGKKLSERQQIYRKRVQTATKKRKKFSFIKFKGMVDKVKIDCFNATLKNHVGKRFSDATKIMQKFISDLNIVPGNVVICCGNHDTLRPLSSSEKTVSCVNLGEGNRCEYEYKSNSEVGSTFEPFEDFLDQLNVANSRARNNESTSVKHCSIDNLRIILLNTNWENPSCVKSGYYCTRCDQFNALMQDDTLSNSDTINIIMAHKPLYEICEKARLSYKNYRKTYFMVNLQEFIGETGIYMCGDKHTRSITHSHFHDIPHCICGEPIAHKLEVEYNLLEITGEHLGIEKKIHLTSKDGINWDCTLRPQDGFISKLYDISKEFLCQNLLDITAMNKTPHTWENLCQTIYSWGDKRIIWYENLDKMYRAICKYRKSGKDAEKWPEKTNMFSFIGERISECIKEDARNILNIRGEYNSGKSTFLGILYIFLLYRYSMGNLDFIPVYYSLENQDILDKIKKGKSYHDSVKESFKEFSDKIQELVTEEYQPVCYIIDGLDEQDCWSYSVEDSIGRGILDVLSTYSDIYYIMSFGQYHLPRFKNTMPLRMYDDRSDIIYFNPIAVQEWDPDDLRFRSFVEAFIKLNSFSQSANTLRGTAQLPDPSGEKTDSKEKSKIDKRCKIVRSFRRLTINPGFMHHNFEYIVNKEHNKEFSTDEAYKYYIDQQYKLCLDKLGYGFVHYAPAMAFLFSYKGYTYERFKRIQEEEYSLQGRHIFEPIRENYDKVYDAFLFIKKEKDASEYLIALHYNRELRYYAEHSEEEIAQDSILNDFMTRNIAVLIRKLWSDTNKFVIMCERLLLRVQLSNCLQSMLLYCLAHQKMYLPLRDQLRNKLYKRAEQTFGYKNAVEALKEPTSWEISGNDYEQRLNQFLDLSLKHTMELFGLPSADDPISLVCSLLKNEMFLAYNRQYQMLYYGDLSIHNEDKKHPLDPGNDVIYKGFDFYNTFNYLYVKLKSKENYPLREFDMLTICDLIRSRLSIEYVAECANSNNKVYTFFYWSEFKEKAQKVLEQVHGIITNYLGPDSYMKEEQNKLENSQEDIVRKYFGTVKAVLIKIIEQYKAKDIDVDKIFELAKELNMNINILV